MLRSIAPILSSLLLAACGASPPPPTPRPEPAVEPEPPPPPPLPEHDLAGAPAFGEPAECVPRADAPGGLSGPVLREALDALETGRPDVIDHRALLATCEVSSRAVAEALADAAVAARGRGEHVLRTALLVQALHADPSHVPARAELARALADTERDLAAMTHLRELRRSEEGLAMLAEARRVRELRRLRERADWFELLYPGSDRVGTAAAIAPSGAPIPAPASVAAHEPGEARVPLEGVEAPWVELQAVLEATPGFASAHEGHVLAPDRGPYVPTSRYPAALFAELERVPRRPAVIWRPTDDATYLLLQYRVQEPVYRGGYATYRVTPQGLRFVRLVEQEVGSCETPREDSWPEDTWYTTPEGDELRELQACGEVASYRRVRHEQGELRVYSGRVQLEPSPVATTDDDWVPVNDLDVAVRVEDGVPVVGAPATCLPAAGALGGHAVRSFLTAFVAGQPVEAPPDEALVASCAVDPAEVSAALSSAARARLADGDAAAFEDLTRRALALDPRSGPSRLDLARVRVRAGDLDGAMSQLEQLAKTGRAGWGAIADTVDESDLAPLRERPDYWAWLVDRQEARARRGITVTELEGGGDALETRLRLDDPEERLERARGSWRQMSDLLSQPMTARRYQAARRQRVRLEALPERVRRGGFTQLTQASWWTPADTHTYLLVPYRHPERGFDAIGLFRRVEDHLVYAGRDRVEARFCSAGDEVAILGMDDGATELRLFTACGEYGRLCRVHVAAGQLRSVCASLAPEGEEPAPLDE